ncbi:uncharacterized protein LOC124145332 [Haliotis rufescens]|uniref:uncharacterized protein LOC124145332 n=1 Tax=Haliotis rufescens TaxID=6454 RepID=UPI00201F65AA|nr:uncharacterized protein LOC124145332 [Haliotis rufescens]
MSSTKNKSARAMKTAQKSDKENCQPISRKKSKLPLPVEDVTLRKMKTRAKPAPNFNKLHSQWTHKLQMGKACQKKPCTVSQEFNLTRPGSKAQVKVEEVTAVKGLDIQAGDRQCFTPDAKSAKDLELNRELSPSQQSGRATIATSKLTTNTERFLRESRLDHPLDRHRPPAKRSKPNAILSLAEQQKQADLPFKTDKSALSSILTNSGIDNRPSVFTPNKQCPRLSIYYQAENRVSLFDNCIKKRLMTIPNDVEKVMETDRICIGESPYVKGARVKPVRNSVYPEYVRRTFLTPSTPKADIYSPISAVPASTARRVPNPNYKALQGSVNRIRKTLRWGDILASPDCTLKADNQKVADISVMPLSPSRIDQCPDVLMTKPALGECDVVSSTEQGPCSRQCGNVYMGESDHRPDVRVSRSGLGECDGMSSTEQGPCSPECGNVYISGTRAGDDSSVKAGVSHHPLNNTGSSSSGGSGHCVRAGTLLPPSLPASSSIVVSHTTQPHTPGHENSCHQHSLQPSRSSALVHPGATVVGTVGVDAAQPRPAMIDIGTTLAPHPGDVSCQRPLQSLEEKERQLLQELQQLNMAMSDEHKQDDNDNNHPHPHQHDLTHHQQQQEQQLLTQQHQQSSRHHPDTSGVSDVIHHLLTPSSRQPPYQRLPHGVTISNVSTTRTHSSVTQGLQLGVPSDINSNVTRVSPGPCPPAPAESQLGGGVSGIQVTQAQIQQQLLAVQQSQLELLRVQQQLEQRLRQSQMSCGAKPDQPEHNNNTDLKCNTQSIPPCGPEQGPSQPACRQEQTQMKSGDINDNYQPSSSAGAAPHLVTDSCDSNEEVKSLTTSSSAVHAGRGLQSTQSDFSLSSSSKVDCISNIEQTVPSKFHDSSHVSSGGQPVSSTSEQLSQGSSENVRESVTHDSSAPLKLRAPCKLPLLREELELTPDVVSGTRKSHSPAPVTSIALGLSMPQPNRPSQAIFEEYSPPTIMPPIWTPLALKVAASRSSPKGDDSNVPSLKLDEESVCSDNREIPESSCEPSEACKRQCVEVSEQSRFRSLLQETKSSAFDQVVPASVTLVTSSLTSVTLSATSPLPPKQARHVPSDTDIYLDALLDDECALFTCRLQTFFRDVSEPERGVQDPVARTLMEGDDMHFVPIHDDLVTTTTFEGSAFSAYSPV